MTIITYDDCSIEFSGHARESVVCHGISAINQMGANYVELHEWGKVERADGYLKTYDVKERYFSRCYQL